MFGFCVCVDLIGIVTSMIFLGNMKLWSQACLHTQKLDKMPKTCEAIKENLKFVSGFSHFTIFYPLIISGVTGWS